MSRFFVEVSWTQKKQVTATVTDSRLRPDVNLVFSHTAALGEWTSIILNQPQPGDNTILLTLLQASELSSEEVSSILTEIGLSIMRLLISSNLPS